MAGLPVLVEHGAWIGPLFVTIPALAGLAAVVRVRRARDRRHAERLVGERAAKVGAPEAGDVVLRGIFRGDHLEVGGERIAFAAPPSIRRGSHARWRWRARAPEHTLRAGAEVIAIGTLARVADRNPDQAASYRREAGAWSLSNAQLDAARPAPCPRPLGFKALGWLAAFAAVMALTAAGLGAVGWNRTATDQPREPYVLGGLDRLAIAAAMPGHRGGALREIDWQLRNRALHDAASDDALVELARLRDGCAGQAATQFAEERYAAAAAGCADTVRLDALLMLGRYEVAHALATDNTDNKDPWDLGLAAVGAADWVDASRIADRYATLEQRGLDRMGYACFAALMRWRSGIADEAGRIAAFARQSPACAVMQVMTLPRAERAGAFAALWLSDGQRVDFHVDALARLARDPAPSGAEVARLVGPPRWAVPDFHNAEVGYIAGWVINVLVSGGPAACQPIAETAVGAAIRGDGAPLADLLERCTLAWTQGAPIVLELLPHLTAHADRVAQALRAFRDTTPHDVTDAPFDMITRATLRADLARAAHDPEEASRWDAIVAAHEAVLADRDRAEALILWHSL